MWGRGVNVEENSHGLNLVEDTSTCHMMRPPRIPASSLSHTAFLILSHCHPHPRANVYTLMPCNTPCALMDHHRTLSWGR